VVHRELQRIARDAVRPVTSEAHLRHRWRNELAELGVPPERRAAAVELVATAVERTLTHERGRWLLDATHRESATELALTGRIGGEIVRTVIDRSFVDRDGLRWIVDYKTSSHEGAGLEAFLDSEQQRYRPQLERYASLVGRLGPQLLRLGLYFPLLGAWREWPAG
jgi:ATP-dependent exoDNAse (exonuclease V) beta subunit